MVFEEDMKVFAEAVVVYGWWRSWMWFRAVVDVFVSDLSLADVRLLQWNNHHTIRAPGRPRRLEG
jgi:hypothetical protein